MFTWCTAAFFPQLQNGQCLLHCFGLPRIAGTTRAAVHCYKRMATYTPKPGGQGDMYPNNLFEGHTFLFRSSYMDIIINLYL